MQFLHAVKIIKKYVLKLFQVYIKGGLKQWNGFL